MNFRNFLLLSLIVCSQLIFSQDDYLNEDGTMSNKFKRELVLASIKEHETPDNRYDVEGLSFVVIVKTELNTDDFEKDELQKNIMLSSFFELLNRINVLKNLGFETFEDAGFNSIIFKVNTIVDYSTKRYHFKFSIEELKSMPDYMDLGEIITYVTSNNNENIIYVKNPAL